MQTMRQSCRRKPGPLLVFSINLVASKTQTMRQSCRRRQTKGLATRANSRRVFLLPPSNGECFKNRERQEGSFGKSVSLYRAPSSSLCNLPSRFSAFLINSPPINTCSIIPVGKLSIAIAPSKLRCRRRNQSHTTQKGKEKRRRKMDVVMVEQPLLSRLNQLLSVPDEMEKLLNAPARSYVRDTKAMASTPADVKEYPSSYVFVIDMPGLKSGEIKVQIEEGNVLSISGERKREEQQQHKEEEEKDKEKEAKVKVKYLRMERRVGKFMRKFNLPKDANVDAISAEYQDGVLTVTVQKVPPPEPKKPKAIEVKVV